MVIFSISRTKILVALTWRSHKSTFKSESQGKWPVQEFNGTIWKAIQRSLKSHQLPLTHWEDTLSDVLYSVRSLLCTSTNSTPHERMFHHAPRSVKGTSIPSWLKPDPIYVKATFEIRTNPWLTKQNYWKSIPAMTTFV